MRQPWYESPLRRPRADTDTPGRAAASTAIGDGLLGHLDGSHSLATAPFSPCPHCGGDRSVLGETLAQGTMRLVLSCVDCGDRLSI